jgi:hypothetical protein
MTLLTVLLITLALGVVLLIKYKNNRPERSSKGGRTAKEGDQKTRTEEIKDTLTLGKDPI